MLIRIIGTKRLTAEKKLVGPRDPFEKGRTDQFSVPNVADIGDITAIALKRDEDGWFPKWQLDREANSQKWLRFDHNDWTETNKWFKIQAICGSRPVTRTSGGSEAPQGAWPWQAMLKFTVYDCTTFCGGSLILLR